MLAIDSLWGYTAGVGSNPADANLLNESIAAFMGNRLSKPISQFIGGSFNLNVLLSVQYGSFD
ncbi:MAG: hypothetical protein HQ457_06475 [Betaproteobacteria bacterium]|nr:hypothetical protein [Betaproteobacteria bacterium]